MKKNLSFILMFILITGCSTVPITGRRQLSFIPEGELLTLSDQSYKEVLSKSQISSNASMRAQVTTVGQKIAAAAESFMRENGMASEIKNYHWEFNLIEDSKTANAFCMPGGKIVVYTGLMPVAQDEAGLATVMGHEVAHAIAHHGGERMSQQLVVQMGGQTLEKVMASKPQAAKNIMLQVYGAGTQFGVLMPYGRSQELEADRIGLILLARAGYDPRKALEFWKRMNTLGGAPPEFLSTHPSNARRIADLTQAIPEAQKYYKG